MVAEFIWASPLWASPQMVFLPFLWTDLQPAGFCPGPGGQDTHPLWLEGSSVFWGSCPPLIPRAKSLFHCAAPSGVCTPETGDRLSPAGLLPIYNNKRRQGAAAGMRRAPSRARSPSFHIFMSSA